MPKVNNIQIRSALAHAEQLWKEYQDAVKVFGFDSHSAAVSRARYAGAETVLTILGLTK